MTNRSRARLGPPPPATSPGVSKTMRANRGKDTGPEIALRRALWRSGLRGYRVHWKGAPGRPDVTYPGRKVAIFVHGCFWHRCPVCDLPLPKSHPDFWQRKFELNRERDRRKHEALEDAGWAVLRFWEHEVRDDVGACVKDIRSRLEADGRGGTA